MNNKRKKRILVIDDEGPIADMIGDFCEALGFEVKEYEADQDVLAVVKHFQPDLITLDLIMPKMSGLEVMEIVKSDPETKDIPILILSSIAGDQSVDEMLRQCQGILQKPIQLTTLREKLSTLVA